MLLGCCHCGEVVQPSYSFSIASNVAANCLASMGFDAVPKKYRITAVPVDGTCTCTNQQNINGNGEDPLYRYCVVGSLPSVPHQMVWNNSSNSTNFCGGGGTLQHNAEVSWTRQTTSSWVLLVSYNVSFEYSHIFRMSFTSLPDPLTSHTVPYLSGTSAKCTAPSDILLSPI